MANLRTYTLIYILLVALATGKFVFFEFNFAYATAIGGTIVLAVTKILLIAGYYQHLIEEPRAISYMMATAVFMVFLLVIAAGYSIQ
ncbi:MULTISPECIES: cytochrome C oxidase subunit IV family protein [Natrialba]|uniref:Cytochrome C oxidase subunit IV n=2 Tax=Natrialba TaxID=63742 RepID=M0AZ78_9EURY|nr:MULTISPECIES: cytochrome C oxidase subunit IV family protein [Natrialba]ELY90861.1 hypothetical protein C484_11576 [Natrialba taiwanensis DSM 12281]ELZ03278.1 hypothetical protein C480_16135 [Natrialba aegyptia DSM 13077]